MGGLRRTINRVGAIGIALLASVILVSFVAAGVDREQRKREAALVIEHFHQSFNAGDFDGICDAAFACRDSDTMRRDWHSLLEGVRNREGAFKHVVSSDMTVYVEPPSVVARCVSAFEKGELKEIFRLRRSEERLMIVSYQTLPKEASNSTRQTRPTLPPGVRGLQVALGEERRVASLAVGLSAD